MSSAPRRLDSFDSPLETDDIETLGDRLMSLAECHESFPIFNSKVELFFRSSDNVEQQSRVLSRLIQFEFEGINEMDLSPEQTCSFDNATYYRLYSQYDRHRRLCVEAITSSFVKERENADGPSGLTYSLIADVLENLEKQDAKFQFSDVEKYRTWLKYLATSIIFRVSLKYFTPLRSQRRSTFAKLFRDFYDRLDKKIRY